MHPDILVYHYKHVQPEYTPFYHSGTHPSHNMLKYNNVAPVCRTFNFTYIIIDIIPSQHFIHVSLFCIIYITLPLLYMWPLSLSTGKWIMWSTLCFIMVNIYCKLKPLNAWEDLFQIVFSSYISPKAFVHACNTISHHDCSSKFC